MHYRKHAGMALWMDVILTAVLIFVLSIVAKLMPIYFDYWRMKSAFSETITTLQQQQVKYDPLTKERVIALLRKTFDAKSVRRAVPEQDTKITPEGHNFKVSVDYEVRTRMLGNIDMVAVFAQHGVVTHE